MDAVTIVVLTLVIAVLAGALAWYGPRRRHWQTHTARTEDTDDGRPPARGESASPDNDADV